MPVEIYTDESVPVAVATGLNRRGIKATSARDAGNLELSDEEQLAEVLSPSPLLTPTQRPLLINPKSSQK